MGDGSVTGEENRFQREVNGLRVEIDRDLCVGFGDCIDASPESFELNEEGIAELTAPESAEREALLRACRSCPVDAITVRDEEGSLLAP